MKNIFSNPTTQRKDSIEYSADTNDCILYSHSWTISSISNSMFYYSTSSSDIVTLYLLWIIGIIYLLIFYQPSLIYASFHPIPHWFTYTPAFIKDITYFCYAAPLSLFPYSCPIFLFPNSCPLFLFPNSCPLFPLSYSCLFFLYLYQSLIPLAVPYPPFHISVPYSHFSHGYPLSPLQIFCCALFPLSLSYPPFHIAVPYFLFEQSPFL